MNQSSISYYINITTLNVLITLAKSNYR